MSKAAPAGEDADLAAHRAAIDGLDREILANLNARARHAQAIGTLKEGSSAYRPEREAQVLTALAAGNAGPLPDAAVTGIFRQIMSACLALEQKLKVAYLGPAGTFSHAAVARHFGAFVDAVPLATIDEIFRAVESGQCDYAVVPVENSTEGAVGRTLDLMCLTDLSVCGEVKLRVQQNLLSNEASLAGVTRIYSHAQSLAQCVHWLANHMPTVPRVAVSSNAEAARLAAAEPGTAAIAGENAAVIYKLANPRRAYRGRTQQHHALLGARPPESRRLGSRRNLAGDVLSQSARRRLSVVGAPCAPWRFDDPLRITPGADRPVGILVLRRPGRPSRRSEALRGARRTRGQGTLPQAAGFVSGGARLIRT